MEIIKVFTYSRDNKNNVSSELETFFADRAKALAFAKNDGRNNGGDALECRHFWSDEEDNIGVVFFVDGVVGDKITRHAEISFHELM